MGDEALTGPVSRGDADTVDSHRRVIAGALPEAVDAYVTLARRTAARALASGQLKATEAESLLDILADSRHDPRG
jgi:predicted short-subunit dehydrogenase-like oxidoreductase (DUF2520 family)